MRPLAAIAGQTLRAWCAPCGQKRAISVNELIGKLGAGYSVSQIERYLSCPAPHCRSQAVELRLDYHEADDPANAVTPDGEWHAAFPKRNGSPRRRRINGKRSFRTVTIYGKWDRWP